MFAKSDKTNTLCAHGGPQSIQTSTLTSRVIVTTQIMTFLFVRPIDVGHCFDWFAFGVFRSLPDILYEA